LIPSVIKNDRYEIKPEKNRNGKTPANHTSTVYTTTTQATMVAAKKVRTVTFPISTINSSALSPSLHA